MTLAARRIGIVGAGIGGLAAAVALKKKGFEVTIFEQAEQIGEVGAGIIVGPNAVKVFRALGLEARLMAISFEPNRHLLRDWKTGRVLYEQLVKGVFAKNYDAGYLQVHRADLIKLLLSALPDGSIILDSKVTAVRSDQSVAAITLTGGNQREFDIVIGADGLRSAVRSSLFGEAAPRFTGNVCWRGVVPLGALPSDLFSRDIHVSIGPGAHVVNYHLCDGELMNFVAIHRESDWRSEAWSFDANRSQLVERFRGWNPELLELFNNAGRCLKWALFDRDPLPSWSQGRITLLGDAAHPMLPYLAQGAAMAIEDGYVLAAILARKSSPVYSALHEYETVRKPRTTRTQLGARARANENHMTSPFSRAWRNIGYAARRLFRPNTTAYKVEWLYSYDVQREFG